MSERDPLAPIIGGFDCSGITDPYSLRCEPFFIDGENGGTLLDGSTVHDILASKVRFSWRLNVMAPAQYAALIAATQGAEVLDTVSAYVYDATIDAVRLANFHVTRPACRTVRNMGQMWAIPQSELVLEEAEAVARFAVTPPAKTVYDVGETLDLTGVTVTQYDRDGAASDITADCSFDPPAGTTLPVLGAVPVAVLLPVGMTAGTFRVNVTAVTYRVTPPTKTSYEIGEPLDLAGVAVTRRNSSGEADVTAECAFDPANGALLLNLGSAPVGVSLGGEAIGSFAVSVVSSEIIASGDWWTLRASGWLDIYCNGNMPYISNTTPWYGYKAQIASVTIGDSVTNILSDAFRGCSALTSATIGNGVTSIGEFAFDSCSALTSMTIPDSVTSIGSYAFRNCSALSSVRIGNSVTQIAHEAFNFCSALTSVTIPDNVTSIANYAFNGCSALTSVTIGNGVTSIGHAAFSGCSALSSVTIPDNVTSMEGSAFSGCSALTSVTIGNSVTRIEDYAFNGCSALTSVTIGNSVTRIGKSAFYSCSRLTSVTIPDNVTSIGWYAFSYCRALTSATIGKGMTSIGYSAFIGCSRLTSVTIGNGVTSIDDDAFNGCANLVDVYYGGTESQWNAISIGSNNTPLTSAAIHYNSAGPT